MSNLRLCCNSTVQNINCKSECVLINTKIYRKYKFQGLWHELEMTMCLLWQSWTNNLYKIIKLSINHKFFYGTLYK